MEERLYQYAVIKHPTRDERKAGARSKIVVPVSEPFLAKGEQEVVMIATRKIPQEEMEHADRLEVAVRPF